MITYIHPMSLYTERLTLRPMVADDVIHLFTLDSDPEVMRYLGNKPFQTMSQSEAVINYALKQYKDYGIGRWAVIDNETGEFIGWSGIKFMPEPLNGHKDFYDIGYRFKPSFWGKGYATECTKFWIKYTKEHLDIPALYATAHKENIASQKVLIKSGMSQNGEIIFELYEEKLPCFWYELVF